MDKLKSDSTAVCDVCGKPATCFGEYEQNEGDIHLACDDCCGHGNEDGWCKPLSVDALRGALASETKMHLKRHEEIDRLTQRAEDAAVLGFAACGSACERHQKMMQGLSFEQLKERMAPGCNWCMQDELQMRAPPGPERILLESRIQSQRGRLRELETLNGQLNVRVKQLEAQDDAHGCPCTIVEPCDPNCTCANPYMSGGCSRCCRYGSEDQRRASAEHLSALEGRLHSAMHLAVQALDGYNNADYFTAPAQSAIEDFRLELAKLGLWKPED